MIGHPWKLPKGKGFLSIHNYHLIFVQINVFLKKDCQLSQIHPEDIG